MTPPIPERTVAAIAQVVDEPARLLQELLCPTSRGRPPTVAAPRLWLAGHLLAYTTGGNATTTNIVRLLGALTGDQRRRLRDPAPDQPIARHHLDYISKRLSRLDYGPGSAPRITDTERTRRQTAAAGIVRALLTASAPPPTGTIWALDATAIESWGRPPKDPHTTQPADPHDPTPLSATGDGTHDPDAAWGYATPTRNGGPGRVYGYHLHALVRIPNGQHDPPVCDALTVTPANADVVEPSLTIIDQLRSSGVDLKELIVDRHYSYKTAHRWANELAGRNIVQHLDLHPNDQGFTVIDGGNLDAGTRLAAGVPHCPATPQHLGNISRPAPNATTRDKQQFTNRIEQRQRHALRLVQTISHEQSRWQCPALAGTIACPLRPATMAVIDQTHLPVIINPPPPTNAPRCCTQTTVTITFPPAQLKLRQPHYWGSTKWQETYAKRTYVEGFFGNLKNPDTEHIRRGVFRTTGLLRVTLTLAAAATITNLRLSGRL